jgi:phage FluMu protein gp41
MREFTMRDSAGRTRIERVVDMDGMPAAIASQITSRITVKDVVSHCSFDWVEPATKEADKIAIVQCGPRTVTLQPTVDGMEIKMTRQVAETTHPFPWQTLQIEPLGEKVVAGVKALGIRQTLTDTQSSPGQPQVTEIWWSPEIKEMIEAKPVGDTTYRLTIQMIDIKRDEPDPAQFYPPAGYKIVTGALPF